MTARRLGLATLILTLLAVGTAWAAFEPEAGSPYSTGTNTDPYAVYAADFNGDARPDLAVLNGSASTVNLFLRQAAGGFAEEAGSPFQAGFGPSFAAIADFNGDARPDIGVANYTGSTVTVLVRQSGGGFAAEPAFSTSRPGSIGAADFNGDGRTDLVVGDYDFGGGTLFVRNAGNTGFTSAGGLALGTNPRQIEVADYNGDGLADIAATNTGTDTVTVLLRSAAGGFVSEGATPVGDAPQDLVAGDFNADGRVDLAVANNAASVTVLLRNAANNGFNGEAGSPITVGGNPAGITSADFNRDGRPDLAVANGTGVVVLLRNATGGFTADAPLTTSSGTPYGIAAADFDADGTPDLATSALRNSLFIFRNPAPAQPQPPAPTPSPAPPVVTPTPVAPPVAGQSVNATPKSGQVKVKLPGSKNYVDLAQAANLPVGTTVDSRDGRVTIVAAGQGGQADFFDGIFKISQSKGSKPLTTLTLNETLSCPKQGKAASAAAKARKRKLWGEGKGNFRTAGKYAAATVRGTKWLVTDYCDRTVVRVTQGSVSVRDNVKKRTVIVRKGGKPYTARAKKR